jgi:6-phospho-beta-glucosidase
VKPRLVVLGGSSVSTPGLALALRDVASEQGLTLVLHGRSPEKLEVVAQACGHALRDVGTVFSELDLRAALDGADLVLNQVRVGGLQARQFDE